MSDLNNLLDNLDNLNNHECTVCHFVDVMYDTPNFDLIRQNYWLVMRQGIRPRLPWRGSNHVTLRNSEWCMIRPDSITLVGMPEIIRMLPAGINVSDIFHKVWASVETARIGNFQFDVCGWTNCGVIDGIPKTAIIAGQTTETVMRVMLARWRPDVFHTLTQSDPVEYVNRHVTVEGTPLFRRLDAFLQLDVSNNMDTDSGSDLGSDSGSDSDNNSNTGSD